MLSQNKDELILIAKLYLYDDLADAYYNVGEKDKAYQLLKELNELIAKRNENIKPLQAINAKYELEGKLKEEELKQQITYILFASITLIILISVLIYYNRFQKIRKLNLKLNELNATKNRLFSIISHDLRGPVSNIQQLLETLNLDFAKFDDKTIQKYLNNILYSIRNISNLLENLLQWSQFQIKTNKTEKQLINIRETIQSVLEQTNYLIQAKNTQVILNCNDCETILINRNEFEIVIRNLLTNALKFSPEVSKIEIKGYKQDKKLVLEIVDEGSGFSFYPNASSYNKNQNNSKQGTNGEKGTGLGLIIVQDILNRNNATINVRQNQPKGSIIQVIFNN